MPKLRSIDALLFALSLTAGTIHAQEQRVSVVVEYIAGSDLYLDAGIEAGIRTADTMTVFAGQSESQLGSFLVVSSSQNRSVVTFAGRPFPVTRGTVLQVAVRGSGTPSGSALPTAQVDLHAEGGSGIRGRLFLRNDGSRMTVRGRSTGMDPGVRYVSRAYGTGSVATGPGACQPGRDMRVVSLGTWVVDSAGNGRLYADSIATSEGSLEVLGTAGIHEPSRGFRVLACGAIEITEPMAQDRAPVASGSHAARPEQVVRRGHSIQATGRLVVDLNVLESSTGVGIEGVDPIDRRFTTPSLRLRMVLTNLPGGLSFNTNLHSSYRYASGGTIEPERAVRVYQASLGKSFEAVPFQLQLGRFYNPFETFSGYWDGLLLHVGGEGLGAGVAAGFEPIRANEGLTTEVPKYSAFLNVRQGDRSLGYAADLSVHDVRPTNGFADQTFIGLSQRFNWQRFHISQRLQVDRDLTANRWRVTLLDLRTRVPLGPRLSLQGQYSRQRSFHIWRPEDPFGLRRERSGLGLSYSIMRGSIGADVTANRLEGQELSYTYTAHLFFPRTALAGLGFSGTASYWESGGAKTLFVAPGIRRSFGSLQLDLSYQRYETRSAAFVSVTHSADWALVFPLTRNVYSNVQARVLRGANLRSSNLYSGLWMSF